MARNLWIIVLVLLGHFCTAQTAYDTLQQKKSTFYDLRGDNAMEFGVGSAVANGDIQDPMFEIYFGGGYKRHFSPHLYAGIGYHKFNLAFKDVYNQGFMSFDFNIGATLMPYYRFSPFVFAGAGYNASNYFKETAFKLQGGGGVEYIVSEGLGIKLYADYNYAMSDELDGVIAGATDDTYFRIGLGLNYYFGGRAKKAKILDGQPSIIKSNQIIQHK
ncbi:MAG TPA: outer membrane beta-barrel protein [Aquaticitalea sp.]|nr:outer membrane beta-barrel protein [Aquaticitalea sp.]